MSQHAAERPVPSLQRKAAIAHAGGVDHRGSVRVAPIPGFDLGRTIFNTLEGRIPRYIMRSRVGKEPLWTERAAHDVERAYQAVAATRQLPAIDADLLRFMVEECDFDVEHADGSFLDHLYFCFEYAAVHYPQQSALVMLLHSILGTGTNTFAMPAAKIPTLRRLLGDHDWRHIEAFPSVLRLLYDLPLRAELRANLARLGDLTSISFRRVIDNEPVTLSGPDFFVQLNYQLIHLIDFLPVADWARNANDTSFILFRDLYDLLGQAGKRDAVIHYTPARERWRDAESTSGLGPALTSLIPVALSEKMAARSVRKFSERIGHSMAYQLTW
jgi:hypothetical protein